MIFISGQAYIITDGMEHHLKSLEASAPVMEAACVLGLSPVIEQDACVTSCPKCSSVMYIMDSGFVCSNDSCSFLAGGVVEMLAVLGHTGINRAVGEFCHVFDSAHKLLDGVDLDEVSGILATRRKLFDFFLKRIHSIRRPMSVARTEAALFKMGMDIDCNRMSAYILDAEGLEELSRILARFDCTLPEIPSGASPLVVPCYYNHHTIKSIYLSFPSRPSAAHKVVHLGKGPVVAWAGLLQGNRAAKEAKIASSVAEMLRGNADAHRLCEEGRHLCYIFKGSRDAIGWKPDKGSVLESDDIDMIVRLSELETAAESLDVTRKSGESVDSREFILEECFRRLSRSGSIDLEAKLALSAAKLSETERNALVANLNAARLFVAADEVKKMVKFFVIHSDDKNILYSSHEGYALGRRDGSPPTPVTNFTLDIVENIVFMDDPDVFHVANLKIGTYESEIVLRPECIDRPKELEASTRMMSRSLEAIPTIKDNSCGRMVSSFLRKQVSTAPRAEGIPFLGWNDQRTRIYGPSWYADRESGCVNIRARLHPFRKDMDHFSNDVRIPRVMHEDLPDEIVGFITQYVGMLVRGFFGYPVKGVAVKNDGLHRDTLMRLAESIGQTSLVVDDAGVRNGRHDAALRGLPYCALSTMPSKRGGMRETPSFCLYDDGPVMFSTTHSDTCLEKARSTLSCAVTSVCGWLFTEDARSFTTSNSVSLQNSYAIEGAYAIGRACGVHLSGSSDNYDLLNGVLGGMNIEAVSARLKYDPETNDATLELPDDVEIDSNKLVGELSALGVSRVRMENGIVTAEAHGLLCALEAFYGRTPKMDVSVAL